MAYGVKLIEKAEVFRRRATMLKLHLDPEPMVGQILDTIVKNIDDMIEVMQSTQHLKIRHFSHKNLVNRVLKMYDIGYKQKRIAFLLDISVDQVYRIVKRNRKQPEQTELNLVREGGYDNHSKEGNSRVIKNNDSNPTAGDIQRSPGTVLRLLREG